ncbi:MAG: M56 family metallopeptidase [Hydrococcus sp. C42_A2020_068]|nr:M56 family metallopeptidase [Hydrococcus sp. C42_A2020_068]
MHALMILLALGLAFSIRLMSLKLLGNWRKSWQRSLFLFLFPPLLLLMTAVAVSCMGYKGTMLGWRASWLSYMLAIGFVTFAGILGVKLSYQAWRSRQKICAYPQQIVEGKIARILETNFPYSAQIGFLNPELVISKGLLNILDREHIIAVLAHEQAHYNNRDTFWFFWLGWLRSLTFWLPNTESLWQELLLLRELRADRQAIQQVDSLLLAESLLLVAQQVSQSSFIDISAGFCAALSDPTSHSCLKERIDLILSEDSSYLTYNWWYWSWIFFVFLPLVTVPLHY